MTTKVVKGSLWTLAGQVAPLPVSLITTYFVIRMLGSEAYGVLILVGLIPTYFNFADFGMGLASTKFGSEAHAGGNPEKEAQVVRTAGLIALIAAAPISILIFVFSPTIAALFNVPSTLLPEASLALRFASVTFVVNFLNGIFNTPQLTRLRMELNTLVTSGFRIAGIITMPLVIYLGGGIIGAVTVLFITALATLLGHLWVSGRLLPQLFDITIDRSIIRPLLKFGGALAVSGIAATLLVNAEKGILTATVSTAALAHYSVAFTLASMMAMFTTALTHSLLPAFSQLQSEEKRTQLNGLYTRGVRLNFILLVPVTAGLLMIAKLFFTLWAGEEFGRESTLPFYLLAAGAGFNIVAALPHISITAAGHTSVFAKLYWLELAPYAIVVWVLSSTYGVAGAAASWSIRVIVDCFIQFYLAKRIANMEFVGGNLLDLSIASVMMFVPCIVVFFYGLSAVPIVVFAICFLVYCFVVWKRVLEKEELLWFAQIIRISNSKL